MTRTLQLAAAFVVPALIAMACGGGDENKTGGGSDGGNDSGASTGGKSNGSGGGSNTGTGGATTGTGGASAGCNLAPCEALAQSPITACCVNATTCGLGAAGFCAPIPEGGFQFPEGGFQFPDGGFQLPDSGAFAPEPIVTDPACKGFEINPFPGFTFSLQGCCDPTGVCGFTAQGFPTCLTAEETATAGFPGGGAIDAGPPIKCHYPDAGASPNKPDASEPADASAD